MKLSKLALVGSLLSSLMLSACTSYVYSGAKTVPLQIDYPELDKEITLYRGEDMILQGIVVENDAYYIKSDISGFVATIPSGHYMIVGEDEDSIYMPLYTEEGRHVVRGSLTDPLQGLKKFKNQNEVCVVSVFNGFSCYDVEGYMTKVRTAYAGKSQKIIKYVGKKGNIARFVFIEIKADRNGDRITNNFDFEQDLSESNIVNFNGATFEVISADQNKITYKVYKKFYDMETIILDSRVSH